MKSSRILLLLLLLVIAAGCSGGGSSGGRSGPTAKLLSITISPSNPTVEQGVSQLFTARGNYSDGTSSFLTSGMTWSSSNTGAAAIDSATGIATSIVSTTTTTITVSSGGISDSTSLMVTPAVLFSLDVEPAISSIAVGSTEQFSAMGTSTNSILTPLTASVIWASSVPDVTIISNATATALASGTTLITARSGNITGSAYLTATGGSAAADNNVMPITVNGSLCAATSSTYINKPCVSVKVCNPGTTTCDTVTDILLDTGSYGLRIFQQALKNVTPASGSLAECVFFGDGSSEWGPVTTVDVYLGNEPAVRIPIQIVDSTFFASFFAGCGIPDASPADAGFNGILGVGVFAEDCGTTCRDFPNNGMYYSCSGSSCTGVAVPLANQVQNPVASLPTDNNGVIVELPSIPDTGAPSVNGILVLGIGTESNNNVPSGVTAFNTDVYGEISTVFNGMTYSSFIDSGSNGLFLPAPSLPICASQPGWFCPSSMLLLSATNQSASALNPSEVLFRIGNLADLIGPAGPYVFSDVGGSLPNLVDLGLPIYLGRNVFLGIEGLGSSLGPGPYIAY